MKALKKIICIILTGALFALTLTSCNKVDSTSDDEKKKNEVQNSNLITVVDHLGNEVAIPKNIDRIVIGSIYPMASVLSIFFDSAEKIVGMPQPCMTAAQNSLLSELYPEILDAETEYINGTDINIEALLELNPDIVIYNAADVQQGEILRDAGIPAVAVSVNKWDYDAVETLENWIKLLSEIFPENEKGDLVKNYSDNVLSRINSRISTLDNDEKKDIFFLFQYTDTMISTSGNHFFGQWWADAIGANNVGKEIEKDNSVTVNMEQIYKWNPECILITNFTTAQPETLYTNEKWQEIDAIKNKQVFKMPLGMYRSYTCGVDTPVTLLWIAKTVYPELFEDINITVETQKYYKDVFGIELTDSQANSIFAPKSEASAF